jgi:putative transposase
MMTRRVHGRVFRLRPSKRTNQIVQYILAVVAKRWGIRIHAVTVMSNHWHVVFTDPYAQVCEFTRDVHALLARHLNQTFGDFDTFWSGSQPSHVRCEEPQDLIDKIAYTLANPVQARLVRYGHHWPGVRLAWPHNPLTVKRPPGFFRREEEGGTFPEEAVLTFHRPPGYEELSDEELAALVEEKTKEREEYARNEADRAGQRFLGRRKVLAQSRHSVPRSPATRSSCSPQVACRDRWRRVERLAQDRAWLEEYNEKRKRWLQGERDVIFPYGTYQLRVQAGVRCAPAPS